MITSSQWTVTEEFRNSPAKKAFSSLDKVFSLAGQKITDDELSNVHKVRVEDTNYYVKRYTVAGKGLRRYLGRSRIRAEWENMLFFRTLGVPAAKVVAYGEEKNWGIMTRGAMITEEVKNTKDLLTMVNENSPLLRDRRWMNQVIKQVAEITRILHQNRFIHTDLKWRNILVTQEETPSVTLIDCPAGVITHSVFVKRGTIKDLACLDKVAKKVLSNTQRLRFYLLYRRIKSLNANDKAYIRKVNTFFLNRE